MKIVYALQDPPAEFKSSVFLVGPTPRANTGGESWRPAMIEALREAGYDGVVYVPEPEDGDTWAPDYENQIAWETRYLERADLLLAWVPRDLETMPGFTTNFELGEYWSSGRLLYGRPKYAEKMRYLDERAEMAEMPIYSSLKELAEGAVAKVEGPWKSSPREEGERSVPLLVWKSPQFQSWYRGQTAVGNRLDDAKLLWSYRVGPKKDFLFCYSLWVNVWIEAESRHKSNEFVFSRTDISAIVAYSGTDIVLVREFRSPVRTRDGFVHELPGGSSFKPGEDPGEAASKELEEETGLRVASDRFRLVKSRQLVSTLSSHVCNLFAVELTPAELLEARWDAMEGTVFGVEEDSERTYVEVVSVDEILENQLLDWSNVGMILEALRAH